MAAGKDSAFATLDLLPPDGIFGINARCVADTNPDKVNLTIGAYRDNEGKPWVLPSVRKAEERIAAAHENHEYLPIAGLNELRDHAVKLALGEDSPAIAESRVSGIQTISGTGALRVVFEFVRRANPEATVYISNPTWGNHPTIIAEAGLTSAQYRYFHKETRGLDFDGMLSDITAAPNGSVILLHSCAHNPTGVDPNPDQWAQLCEVIKEKGHFPVFDTAYQGFASGDPAKDAAALRSFVEAGVELGICQSFSKNFGLYGQRAGCASIVTTTPEQAEVNFSHLCAIARPMYSNPPKYGAKIVTTILTDPELYQDWLNDLITMSGRIYDMRQALYDELVRIEAPGTWNHILDQIGMFSFTGLDVAQSKAMTDRHSIYMLTNGRISMAGLSASNVAYVAAAIKDVLTVAVSASI